MESHYGRDLLDWWKGKLSSRKLFNLIKHLPDEGPTKTAMRDGDWCEEQYIRARMVNEIILSRADQNQSRKQPSLILSPAQQKEKASERQMQIDLHEMMLAQMRGEFIPPTRNVAFVTEDLKGPKPGG